ncbi:nitrate- and nitrite sensing domain-containing protein [Nonomuraea sp. NPDC048892]|uniref:sensor histidine kinase n=1 Tax=Nonomuraea sp. NPDC048892 TaxID=3154624 RepID=UPI00340979F5
MSSPPPIRTKLLRILLLPLVSMVALWGFIAYSSVEEIITVSQNQNRWEAIGEPVLQLIVELQKERQLSAEAPDGTADFRPLADQRRITDTQVTRLREIIATVDVDGDDSETPAQVQSMVQALDGLQALRASADGGVLAPPLTIIQAYDNLIATANRQFTDRDALSDVSSFRGVRGMAAFSATAEYLGREHAVLTTTIVHRNMTPADRGAFVAATTARRLVFANAERDAGPELRADYDRLVASEPYKRLVAVEDILFSWDTDGAPPVDPAAWRRDTEAIIGGINRDTQTELARVAAEAEAQKTGAYWRIGVVLLIGLAVVVASLALSYRFGRSLIDELMRLQGSAVELAEQRLPRLVERLRRGEDVDPATEAPGLPPAETAEVDRVVHAFSAVRRTAVEAAVGQAALRKGVGQVFLNLARRNQALLHRQLALLDTMERRVDEPQVLEDLFKLDHLTTRMRRHAENLIIMSDSSPARRWRDPVPVFDVVRAAVLEVEDYTRVTVTPMPNAPLLLGAAVTDVIHLIAELVENATVFSPPNTTVHVRGVTAANGLALEVEDRGLGLNDAVLSELNARLADVPEFDLADTDRLGLFVVSRLAARHGIKIVLRRSPYDGTTAIVLLPATLLAGAEPPAIAAAPGTGRPVRALSMAPSDGRGRGVTIAPEPDRATWFEAAPANPPHPAESGPVLTTGPIGVADALRAADPLRASDPMRTDPPATSDRPRPADPGPAAPGGADPARATGPTGMAGAGEFGNGSVPARGPAPGNATEQPRRPVHGRVPGNATVPPQGGPGGGDGPSRTAGPPTGWSVTVPAQEADEDLDGLPMRIPQASLAPQLRVDARPERGARAGRSPEELAQLMSSMQRGWQQGRRQAKQERDMQNGKDDQPHA